MNKWKAQEIVTGRAEGRPGRLGTLEPRDPARILDMAHDTLLPRAERAPASASPVGAPARDTDIAVAQVVARDGGPAAVGRRGPGDRESSGVARVRRMS